ncbi:type II secretion system F family protein [Burkholderia cepacia]|uniref:type II secretion system protein n=1 Tax=Burkholderia cepacia TaxID=292 RepID=UPI002ABDD9BF|nr:type II secretion system protein [Burkholderia cepacia]
MIGTVIYRALAVLPPVWRARFHAWRFRQVREMFYEETRLDIDRKGHRPRETLIERIETLAERDERRGGLVWPAYHDLLGRLRAGDDFATALKPFVPLDEYALLEISTSSTRVDAVARGFALAGMVAHAKRVLSGRIRAELAYPVLLLVMAFLLAMLFGGLVFPDLPDLQPVNQWLPLGQLIYAVNTFAFRHWPVVLIVVAALIGAYFAALRYWTGPVRNQVDSWPFLFRNHRDLEAARFIVALASLFESGLPLRAALNRLAEHATPWLAWHLKTMHARLDDDPEEPLMALDTGMLSRELVDRIADSARRANFEEAVRELGHASLGSVIETIRRNARVTHFVMLVVGLSFVALVGLGSYITVASVGVSAYSAMQY